jgi:hypothetical protein
MDNLDPELRRLLVEFLSALLPILVTFVSGVAGFLMLEARRLLVEKVGQERARTVEHFVRLGVFAAEQYLQSAEGQAKKQWALAWIEYQLKLRGIAINYIQVSELIEAIVGQEQFNLQSVHLLDQPDIRNAVSAKVAEAGA